MTISHAGIRNNIRPVGLLSNTQRQAVLIKYEQKAFGAHFSTFVVLSSHIKRFKVFIQAYNLQIQFSSDLSVFSRPGKKTISIQFHILQLRWRGDQHQPHDSLRTKDC